MLLLRIAHNSRRGKEGFTLVELLIVVAIIGILAAIAVPEYVRARDDARNKAVVGNAESVIGVITVEMEHQRRAGLGYGAVASAAVDAFIDGGPILIEQGTGNIIRLARAADSSRTPNGNLPAYIGTDIGNGALYQVVLSPSETVPSVMVFPNLNDGTGGIQVAPSGWPKDIRGD